MIRIVLSIILVFSALKNASANEIFEGVIEYKVEVESFTEKLPVELLKEGYGSDVEAYYKPGYEKIVLNNAQGVQRAWEIYVASENKKYSMITSDIMPTTFDGGEEARKLKSFSDKDSDLKILGKKTRLITVEYADGTISNYWYSPSIFIDPVQFKNLKFAYLNRYWKIARSPYLKHERHHGEYKIIYSAVKVRPEKLDDRIFSVWRSTINSWIQI
ncbi:hypothetical protein [uncultured Microbulbifer sp.]|uniref:hypothetical protein n=1 Tax=uncultured Microbulbifer sp. TaxID=348147 RepID=UPI00261C9A66|nr:hypothetical protein [uncultured Microbulbifer sp.]